MFDWKGLSDLNLYRHLNLWNYACLNLTRFKSRTLAVLVPMTLAMTFAATVTLIRDGFEQDAGEAIRLLPDITVQRLIGGRAERMNLDYVAIMQRISEVRKVFPRIWGYLPVKIRNGEYTLTIMGLNAEEYGTYGIVKGRMPSALPGECVIGEGVAKLIRVRNGQRFSLRDDSGNEHRLKVVGVLHSRAQIYGADLIITNSATARQILGYENDELSDIGVMVKDPLTINAIAAKIAKVNPELRVLSRDALGAITQQAYGGRAGLFQLMWLILLATVLLTVWAQATALSVGLAHEVGILKATGWAMGDVIEVKVLESFILGLAGTLGGMVLGIAYILMGAPEIRGFFLGWSAIFPETKIPIAMKTASVISLVSIGLIPLLAVTIVPIWRLGSTDPDTALRS